MKRSKEEYLLIFMSYTSVHVCMCVILWFSVNYKHICFLFLSFFSNLLLLIEMLMNHGNKCSQVTTIKNRVIFLFSSVIIKITIHYVICFDISEYAFSIVSYIYHKCVRIMFLFIYSTHHYHI